MTENVGFTMPPIVPPTGDEKVDKLIGDYNKAVYMLNGGTNGDDYIVSATIRTPPGWRAACVIYTTKKGTTLSTAVNNFESLVSSIVNMTDISLFKYIGG